MEETSADILKAWVLKLCDQLVRARTGSEGERELKTEAVCVDRYQGCQSGPEWQ